MSLNSPSNFSKSPRDSGPLTKTMALLTEDETSLYSKLLYALIWLLSFILAYLPLRLSLRIGALGGGLFFWLAKRRRSIAIDNLTQAVKNKALPPDLNIRKTARGSFENLGRTAAESFRLAHRGLKSFKGLYRIIGEENIPKANPPSEESRAPGLIFLTGHVGNWELSSKVIAESLSRKLTAIGRHQSSLAVNRFLIKLRTKDGGGFIFKRDGARAMLKLLRQGGVLGTLFDQADLLGQSAVRLNLMGKPALTTLGPLKLAAKTGAAVTTLFGRREGLAHVFEIVRSVIPPPQADRSWLISEATLLNDLLSQFISCYPDQWMWCHRRWKTPESLVAQAREDWPNSN
ncbi:MAG: lysophospholipid acyltransferase family protein [Deltaproteobacteria bacterium]|jgi:KDO2-lipid IV(A) lauroyltransferase|nr:lysophospholipid acyltransferase family protein [Deltaproteobacteria bacterium]